MPFGWLRYVSIAEELLKRDPEEYHRSAASRAYHGLFGAIRDRLASYGVGFASGSEAHGEVIDFLVQDDRPEQVRLGFALERLRRLRNDADYDGEQVFPRSLATESINPAREMLSGGFRPL